MTHDRPGIFRSYREALTTLLVWLCGALVALAFYTLCFYFIRTALAQDLAPGSGGGVTPPVTQPPLGLAPIPDEEWSQTIALDAARCCFAEASFRLSDCAAILYVITRRWTTSGKLHGWTWHATLKRYSSLWPPRTPRQARIAVMATQWPNPDERLYTARWEALQRYVQSWKDGMVRNPCKGAVHWGSESDPHPTGTVLAICTSETANRFYR